LSLLFFPNNPHAGFFSFFPFASAAGAPTLAFPFSSFFGESAVVALDNVGEDDGDDAAEDDEAFFFFFAA